MRRLGGFTLIELLIVLGIIAVLAALATIGSRGLLIRGRLAETASAIERQVRDARLDVKRTDTSITLVFDADDVLAPGERRVTLRSGVELRDDAATIALQPPLGTWADSVDGDVTLTLESAGIQRDVIITGVLARVVPR